MLKTSQKRSRLNKLREITNIGGIAAEKFFNPEFERVMTSLRDADNKLRSIATGTSIEGEDAGKDAISFKELLKNAKSYLNRREYMTGIAFLSRFQNKLQELTKISAALNLDVDKVHHDFLFKDLDTDQKQHLHDLKSRFASPQPALIAEANIMDFLVNIGTERGRALAAWEKRYPKQIGKLKKDTDNLYDQSDKLLRNLLSLFKEMASARATRKIDNYMASLKKMDSYVANYNELFKKYYNENIKGFLDKQELITPSKPVADKEMGQQQIEVAPKTIPDLQVPERAIPEDNVPIDLANPKTIPDMSGTNAPTMPPSGHPALTPPRMPTDLGPAVPMRDTSILPPAPEEEAPNTEPSPSSTMPSEDQIDKALKRPSVAHQKFFTSLQVMSQEQPAVLIAHISKYAKSIERQDPYVAIQLLNIIKSLRS